MSTQATTTATILTTTLQATKSKFSQPFEVGFGFDELFTNQIFPVAWVIWDDASFTMFDNGGIEKTYHIEIEFLDKCQDTTQATSAEKNALLQQAEETIEGFLRKLNCNENVSSVKGITVETRRNFTANKAFGKAVKFDLELV